MQGQGSLGKQVKYLPGEFCVVVGEFSNLWRLMNILFKSSS